MISSLDPDSARGRPIRHRSGPRWRIGPLDCIWVERMRGSRAGKDNEEDKEDCFAYFQNSQLSGRGQERRVVVHIARRTRTEQGCRHYFPCTDRGRSGRGGSDALSIRAPSRLRSHILVAALVRLLAVPDVRSRPRASNHGQLDRSLQRPVTAQGV